MTIKIEPRAVLKNFIFPSIVILLLVGPVFIIIGGDKPINFETGLLQALILILILIGSILILNLTLFFNHFRVSKDIVVNLDNDIVTIERFNAEILKYSITEIKEIYVVEPPLGAFFGVEEYSYMRIIFKDGDNLIITSLMHVNLFDLALILRPKDVKFVLRFMCFIKDEDDSKINENKWRRELFDKFMNQ